MLIALHNSRMVILLCKNGERQKTLFSEVVLATLGAPWFCSVPAEGLFPSSTAHVQAFAYYTVNDGNPFVSVTVFLLFFSSSFCLSTLDMVWNELCFLLLLILLTSSDVGELTRLLCTTFSASNKQYLVTKDSDPNVLLIVV